MSQAVAHQWTRSRGPHAFPAEITCAGTGDDGRYRLSPLDGSPALQARPALADPRCLSEGDRVLAIEDGDGAVWIIGMIGSPAHAARRIAEHGGASATVEGEGRTLRLVVRDRGGRLLFEHDPASGRSVLHPTRGDLQIAAPEGSIDLRAGRKVRISGAEGVEIETPGAVAMRGGTEQGASTLRVGRESLDLNGDSLRLRVRAAAVAADTTHLSGHRLHCRIARAAMAFDALEVRAKETVHRVKEAFTCVEQLMHLRVGRLWGTVREAFHVKSKSVSVKAEQRVHIDGRSIDLG